MSTALVAQALTERGITASIQEFDQSTRTAADAARALGCTEAEIGKSIVFRLRDSGEPVIVIASGKNRVSEKRLESILGAHVEKADADYVKQSTGYVIGGVPPVGHLQQIRTVLDCDLLTYSRIFVAAGTPRTVVGLDSAELRCLLPEATVTSIT